MSVQGGPAVDVLREVVDKLAEIAELLKAPRAASNTEDYPDAERIGVVAPWEDVSL